MYWTAIGGFDERFPEAWREDSDLQFTLLEQGYTIKPAPQAVVTHPVRPAPWGVGLKMQRKSQFEALLYKKHPQTLSRAHPQDAVMELLRHGGRARRAGRQPVER